MKVLFICSNNVETISSGGSQCTNRNYLSLKEIVGPENIEIVQLTPKLSFSFASVVSRISNYLVGFNAGLSKREIQKIVILSRNCQFVYIDTSEHGAIGYHLKKNNFKGKIITFFHNVEHTLYLQRVKKNPFLLWRSQIIHYNEKLAIKYSNKIIVLTSRDLEEIKRVYKNLKIPETFVIPISFKDKFSKEKIISEKIQPPLKCLFVGDAWFANLHGIQWFIDNVLDKVDIKLQIAGKASEALKLQGENAKIEYLGFVPSLSTVMIDADIVLAPIFKGGGMKVKICEALMFGKHILGTKEAFNGYEIDLDKTGAVCDSEVKFVNAIKKYSNSKEDKFNEYNRNCFLEKYSFQATYKKFVEVLSDGDHQEGPLLDKDLHLQKN